MNGVAPAASCTRHPYKPGIIHALLPGARLDRNTQKVIIRMGSTKEIITFNVGGTLFETYKSTLRSLPNFKLADEEFLARHYRPDTKDHFFDRDPEIFHCVLNYLRTGELHLPTSVCGPVVKSELEYWGVNEKEIEECCWSRYSAWSSTLKALRRLEDDRKATAHPNYPIYAGSTSRVSASRLKTARAHFWRFLLDPKSSSAAQVYAYMSLIVIFVSIFSFCAQTHTTFQVKSPSQAPGGSTVSPALVDTLILSNQPVEGNTAQEQAKANFRTTHPVLLYLDIACTFYLLLELTARLLTTPNLWQLVTSPMTVVDCVALLPDLADFLVKVISSSDEEYGKVADVLDYMKVVRVFRVFRLMLHIPGLWILFYTLKSSIWDLLLLLLYMFIGMLIFSSFIYFAENTTQPDKFNNIPKCFWWAVVTMTTVGYGDMYPETSLGYLIGTATSISGVLMIGFTVPVLVNNFLMYYNHTRASIRRERRSDPPNPMEASLDCVSGWGENSSFGGTILGLRKYSISQEKDCNHNNRMDMCQVVYDISSAAEPNRASASSSEGEEDSLSQMRHGDLL